MSRKEEILKELYPEDLLNLSLKLTEGEAEVLYNIRQALEKHLAPVIDEYYEKAEFPFDEFYAYIRDANPLADERLSTPDNPYTLSRFYSLFLAYELGRFDNSIATFQGVHSGLGYYSFLLGGSDEQVERWIPKLRTFELQTCFALTEPDHGSDIARGVETTARREGNKWILNGEKKWIGGASSADLIPVYAVDEESKEIKCFIVEQGAPGLKIEDIQQKTGLRMVQNGHIYLENVEVLEENRLQRINGFKDVARVLYETRGGVANQAAGTQAGIFHAAKKYTSERVQFGKTIDSYQLIQEKLARILANLTSSLTFSVSLAERQIAGDANEVTASLAKFQNSKLLRESAQLGREVCGGNGILLENKVARFLADSEVIYTYEGTHEVNALVVGRAITGKQAFV